MGYQQLIMLVLSVIIIGLSIAVGIAMFNQKMVRNNRLAIIDDLTTFAGIANTYYRTPTGMGGGDGIWDIDKLGISFGLIYDTANNSVSTENGTFVISSTGDILTIVGTGTETGFNGSTNVKATITLTGSSSEMVTSINN